MNQQALSPQTPLQGGRYTILRTLGQGGFGITYLAMQRGLEREVVVKEFFMKMYCDRVSGTQVTLGTAGSREEVGRFREKFLKEARNIAQLHHPNIVQVFDVFEENGTAYYVMEYASGGSLADKVAREGALSEAAATYYIRQIAQALSYLHQRRKRHLGVKPTNIILDTDYNALLSDFGLVEYVRQSETCFSLVGISEGFSAPEQYSTWFGVFNRIYPHQTDVYALGATFLFLLTGKRFLIVPVRLENLMTNYMTGEALPCAGVSSKAIFAIEQAMKFRLKDRLQNVEEFIKCLSKGTYSEDESTKTLSFDNDAHTFTVNGVSFDMMPVEGGTFTMGATSEQGSDAEDDERPTHEVTLDSYYIGKTEVTQALWEAVMGNNPSYFKGANRPVEYVSWDDCQEFIAKLNQLTGKTFRLPTEAEWEFAARGGNKSRGYKYAGSNNLGEVAWYRLRLNGGSETHDVGTKCPNELGLYDMSGNVREWCSDWYGDYSSASQTNPTGPSSGSCRVLRGGGCKLRARFCRVSDRKGSSPGYRIDGIGLRLALL